MIRGRKPDRTGVLAKTSALLLTTNVMIKHGKRERHMLGVLAAIDGLSLHNEVAKLVIEEYERRGLPKLEATP